MNRRQFLGGSLAAGPGPTGPADPFQPTMMIELANDYRGYIPTPDAFETGGYETWRAKSSHLEKQAAPKLVAAALRQLASLPGASRK